MGYEYIAAVFFIGVLIGSKLESLVMAAKIREANAQLGIVLNVLENKPIEEIAEALKKSRNSGKIEDLNKTK